MTYQPGDLVSLDVGRARLSLRWTYRTGHQLSHLRDVLQTGCPGHLAPSAPWEAERGHRTAQNKEKRDKGHDNSEQPATSHATRQGKPMRGTAGPTEGTWPRVQLAVMTSSRVAIVQL